MSDVMLLGVLRMPSDLWMDSPLDVMQRHGFYVSAADRIEADAAKIEQLETENGFMHDAYLDVRKYVAGCFGDDDDSTNACQRVALRELEEAMGEQLTRLLREKPGQHFGYGHWKELASHADQAETQYVETLKKLVAAETDATLLRAALAEVRKEWLDENDPKDGTDCVTPYDHYFYRGVR